MTLESRSQENEPHASCHLPGAISAEESREAYLSGVPRTSDGRLFVFLKVIIDKAEDEG